MRKNTQILLSIVIREKMEEANITAIRAEEERRSLQQQQEPHEEVVVDSISQLPDCILLSILSLLTLEESATTTVLSKRWRHLFSSLPELTFIEGTRSFRSKDSNEDDRLYHNICDILDSRCIPLKSCSFIFNDSYTYGYDVNDIILLLSDNDIKKLSLTFSGYHCTVPSSLFSCREITHLDLYLCILEVPSKFKGLRRLRDLILERCIFENEDFVRLFSCCRAIERLVLNGCYISSWNLVVNAPTLIILDITISTPLFVLIENAPCLESVTLRYQDTGVACNYWDVDTGEIEHNRFVMLLKGFHSIQNLSLDIESLYVQVFTKEGLLVPKVLPFECRLHKLKKLTLRMQFDKVYVFSMVSCLLNSCPILEELAIWHNARHNWRYREVEVGDFWDKQIPLNSLSNQLATVTLYSESKYSLYWIKFTKFLLINARDLKRVVINLEHKIEEQSAFVEF